MTYAEAKEAYHNAWLDWWLWPMSDKEGAKLARMRMDDAFMKLRECKAHKERRNG